MGPFLKLDNPFYGLGAEYITTDAIAGISRITDDISLSDPGDDFSDMSELRVILVDFKNHVYSVFRLA